MRYRSRSFVLTLITCAHGLLPAQNPIKKFNAYRARKKADKKELEDRRSAVLIKNIQYKSLYLIQCALWAGADINRCDADGNLPINVATRLGSNRILQGLIAAGADVNEHDDAGNTPLHYVRRASIAKTLLAAGAKIETRNAHGWTPLHQAARAGLIDVVVILVAHGADIAAVTEDTNQTPLNLAEEADSDDSAAWLAGMIKGSVDTSSEQGTGSLVTSSHTGSYDEDDYLLGGR